MARYRLEAIERSKRLGKLANTKAMSVHVTIQRTFLAYLLVEWEEEEEGHSVIDSKVAKLQEGSDAFVPGARVRCQLQEGEYLATIISAGICTYTDSSH